MARFRPGIAHRRRLPVSAFSLAMATGLLVAACSSMQTATTGAVAAHETPKPSATST